MSVAYKRRMDQQRARDREQLLATSSSSQSSNSTALRQRVKYVFIASIHEIHNKFVERMLRCSPIHEMSRPLYVEPGRLCPLK